MPGPGPALRRATPAAWPAALVGHGRQAGHMPVGQGVFDPPAGTDLKHPGPGCPCWVTWVLPVSDSRTRAIVSDWQVREAGQRLGLELAALPSGAAQQGSLQTLSLYTGQEMVTHRSLSVSSDCRPDLRVLASSVVHQQGARRASSQARSATPGQESTLAEQHRTRDGHAAAASSTRSWSVSG